MWCWLTLRIMLGLNPWIKYFWISMLLSPLQTFLVCFRIRILSLWSPKKFLSRTLTPPSKGKIPYLSFDYWYNFEFVNIFGPLLDSWFIASQMENPQYILFISNYDLKFWVCEYCWWLPGGRQLWCRTSSDGWSGASLILNLYLYWNLYLYLYDIFSLEFLSVFVFVFCCCTSSDRWILVRHYSHS